MNRDLYIKCLYDYKCLGYNITDNNEYIVKKRIDPYYNKKYKLLKKEDIPNNITHLSFGDNFNQELNKGDIPESVIYLNLGDKFNQELKEGVIPESVIHLNLGNKFNKPLKQKDIPNGVIHLKFSHFFNQLLKKGDIPESVMYLWFEKNFNQKLDKNILPKNILKILFHKNQNQNQILDLTFDNNILIAIIDDDYEIEYNNKININYFDNDLLEIYIEKYLTKDKLIGHIILKELIKKVFHPKRLLYLSDTYKINIENLLEMY